MVSPVILCRGLQAVALKVRDKWWCSRCGDQIATPVTCEEDTDD